MQQNDPENHLEILIAIASRYEDAVLGKNQALKEAHDFSTSKVATLRREASEAAEKFKGIECIAVAGSLARKDGCPHSDLDIVTIVDNLSTFDKVGYSEWLDDLCKKVDLQRSNPHGVFADPIEKSTLIATAGKMSEDYKDLSRRVLLLLESTWLCNEEGYQDTIAAIIDKYAEDVKVYPRKNFVFLLNDVIRYFRTICVNYQHSKVMTDYGKWPIRNVKLRHSRVVMYFSLVACIGMLSKYEKDDKIDVLKCLISMEPLLRLYVIYELSVDSAFFRLAEYYNTFLILMGNNHNREALKNLEYENRYSSTEFSLLKANSDALAAELLRFFRARHAQWDERFFEYMII